MPPWEFTPNTNTNFVISYCSYWSREPQLRNAVNNGTYTIPIDCNNNASPQRTATTTRLILIARSYEPSLIVMAYSTINSVGGFGAMEEEENECGIWNASTISQILMRYFIQENGFWAVDWIFVHYWDEDSFVLHGFRLPSNRPQLRPLLLCMKTRCEMWPLFDTKQIVRDAIGI